MTNTHNNSTDVSVIDLEAKLNKMERTINGLRVLLDSKKGISGLESVVAGLGDGDVDLNLLGILFNSWDTRNVGVLDYTDDSPVLISNDAQFSEWLHAAIREHGVYFKAGELSLNKSLLITLPDLSVSDFDICALLKLTYERGLKDGKSSIGDVQ